MSIWDHTAKKPLRHYPTYVLEMQDIRFNVDRSRLAVGVSYGWEHGKDAPLTLFGRGCGCGDGVGEYEEEQGERLWRRREGRRRAQRWAEVEGGLAIFYGPLRWVPRWAPSHTVECRQPQSWNDHL